jgi:glyoxylase-like metal-dependent hydrolase (beta-lactamase superfamily II)
VDLILLTHLHYDHVGGITTKDGKRVFPNAEVRMAKTESDFWLSEKNATAASKNTQGSSDQASDFSGQWATWRHLGLRGLLKPSM